MNGLLIFWGFVALLALLEITQMAIRILRGISDKDTRVNDGPWPYMVITPIGVCLYLLIYGLVRDLNN